MKDNTAILAIQDLINPRSIAIIGASEKTMYGKGIFESLTENGYNGKIFLVNPKRDKILNEKCYKSLAAIKQPIDLAIVIIGRKYILDTLRECVQEKVKGALIITAGFGEADEEGKRLEKLIRQFAEENSLLVWGPNCAGFANFRNSTIATLLREEGREPLPGTAGLISQSGALMMSLVGVARDKGLGINYAISTGNEVNLESANFMEYMLEDPRTKVIMAFVEGFKNVKCFSRMSDLALERGKPLCILKVGRSELGEKAAASHTGSITGSDNAYETIFKQKGIIRVVDTDELIEVAKVCAVTKWPKSSGIAIITSSGGTGSLSADLCAQYGLDLAQMSQETMKALVNLEELLTFEELSNPIDVRGQGIRALAKILPLVLNDQNFGMAVVTICFSAVGSVANNVATIVRDAIINTNSEKPVFVLWVGRRQRLGGSYEIEEGFEILERAGIPVFSEPQRCFKTIRKIIDFYAARMRYLEGKNTIVTAEPESHKEKLKPILDQLDQKEMQLTEYSSKKLLSIYGMPVTREKLAITREQADEFAKEIGYPVALKVMSSRILHKSDAEVIALNITKSSELLEAYDTLISNAKHYDQKAGIQGILVQEMVAAGVETILGMKNDPQFGPIIVFGLGGIFVEIYKDVTYRFPPITEKDAYGMIEEIRGYPILQGIRSNKEYDIQALVDTMVKFSSLCQDAAELLKEVDINPLIVGYKGNGVRIVDSLMVRL